MPTVAEAHARPADRRPVAACRPRPPTGRDDDATPFPPPACPRPRFGDRRPRVAQTADPFALRAGGRLAGPRPRPDPAAFTVSDIRIDGLQRISAGTVFTYLPVERGDTLDRATRRRGDPRAVQDRLLRGRAPRPPGRHPGGHRGRAPGDQQARRSTGNKDIKTEDLTQGPEGHRPGRRRDLRPPRARPRDPGTHPPVQQPRQVQRRDHARPCRSWTATASTSRSRSRKARRPRSATSTSSATRSSPTRRSATSWESSEQQLAVAGTAATTSTRARSSPATWRSSTTSTSTAATSTSASTPPRSRSAPTARTCSSPPASPRASSTRSPSVKVTGDTVLPQGADREDGAGQGGPDLLAPPARVHAPTRSSRRSATSATPSRRSTRSPTSTAKTRPSASTSRSCPGPRVNVRRIVFKGNTRTADEVLRREMRQFEGAWYSQAAIDRSKIRLQRLGYFETVEVENAAGRRHRRPGRRGLQRQGNHLGQLRVRPGLLAADRPRPRRSSCQQNNFLGSGNRVSVAGAAQQLPAALRLLVHSTRTSPTNGMSLGYNLWWREFDYSDFNTAQYSTNSGAAQVVPRPADHRDRHGLGAVRHRQQRDPARPAPRRSRSSTTSTRSASAPSTPGARSSAGRATRATTTSCRPAAATSASGSKSRCRARPSSTSRPSTSSRLLPAQPVR